MHTTVFQNAKNSLLTCTVDGLFLHSSYSPDSEAKRFCDTQNVPFNPSSIFFIEPGISYAAEELKKRFENVPLFAIRFSHDFDKYNSLFDGVFYFTDENTDNFTDERKSCFENEIYKSMNEKALCSSLFLQWPASTKIYKEETEALLPSIKNIIEKAKVSLVTESFFSKRWFLNKLIFEKYIRNTAFLNKGDMSVVVAASGPSLEGSIPALKKARNSYFLIAASSALSALLKNSITPDLVVSTDGGWWAKNHLLLNLKKYDFPFALTTESAFPKTLFESKTIIPILYKDAKKDETQFFDKMGIKYFSLDRNGTVSGTMLEIAKKITTGNIYFAGLDLEATAGRQHSEPNRNEAKDTLKDSKIKNKETRLSMRRFSSKSLEIYRNWFSSIKKDEAERLFRIEGEKKYSNKLGNIKDLSHDDFFKAIMSEAGKTATKIELVEKKSLTQAEIKEALKFSKNFLIQYEKNEEADEELFPSETLFIKKSINDLNMEEKLSERKKAFFEKAHKLFSENNTTENEEKAGIK